MLLVSANRWKTDGKLNIENPLWRKTLLNYLENQYSQIIQQGRKEEPLQLISSIKKRGKIAKPKSLKLLETFVNRREQIMRFVHNKDVPFDNNLAERDIRMVKLKQKISGCFRTLHGAQVFCRIRSYISTIHKQGYAMLFAIEKAMMGNPLRVCTC